MGELVAEAKQLDTQPMHTMPMHTQPIYPLELASCAALSHYWFWIDWSGIDCRQIITTEVRRELREHA
jgi:hypothetical protein